MFSTVKLIQTHLSYRNVCRYVLISIPKTLLLMLSLRDNILYNLVLNGIYRVVRTTHNHTYVKGISQFYHLFVL